MSSEFTALLRRLFADTRAFKEEPISIDVREIVERELQRRVGDVVSELRGTSRIVNSVVPPSVAIGDFALVRNSVLTEGCIVGAHAQLNWAFIGAASELPHMNNVAYSIVGEAVLLGAGTVTSSRRLDGATPRVALPDGQVLVASRDRFGALVGDGCRVGSLVCLNPFTVLGPGARVRPAQSVSGYIDSYI